MEDKKPQGRIEWIDGLKGVACLMIFTHHFMLAFLPATYFGVDATSHNPWDIAFSQSPFSVFANGDFWVFAFCILSDILISFLAIRHHNENNYIANAMVKRYFRFSLPVFILGILAFCIQKFDLLYTTQADIYAGSPWLRALYSDKIFWVDIIRSPFFSVLFQCDGILSTALWMLTHVFVGSFIAWILTMIVYKRIRANIVCLVMFVVLTYQKNYYLAVAPIGVVIAQYLAVEVKMTKIIRKRLKVMSVFFLSVGLLFGGYPSCASVIPNNIYAFFPPKIRFIHMIGASLTISGLVLSPMQKIFTLKYFTKMGRQSFEVYLIHIPLIATLSSWMIYMIMSNTRIGYMWTVYMVYVITLTLLMIVSQVINTKLTCQIEYLTKKIVSFIMEKG